MTPLMSERLERYREMRDFRHTPEPRGRFSGNTFSGKGELHYYIQRHDARQLHYDFRLEMDGTLKSWAVPKGVATELGVKHSAFAVEDHPIGYLEFEGTIPKGQYVGGTQMVRDFGKYQLMSGGGMENMLE